MKGLFITFEGPEGSGKSTQIKLLRQFLAERGHDVVTTREPGGTAAGDRIRSVLLDKDCGSLEPETELFLMLAQRLATGQISFATTRRAAVANHVRRGSEGHRLRAGEW